MYLFFIPINIFLKIGASPQKENIQKTFPATLFPKGLFSLGMKHLWSPFLERKLV